MADTAPPPDAKPVDAKPVASPPLAVTRGVSVRTSIQRLRASTSLPPGSNFRSSMLRGRSSSIELLLFEVRSAFDPNSRAIHTWHQLLLACLVYEVAALPYLVTFRGDADHWLTPELAVLYACEVLFLADIYVELNTGYYEDGNVTRDASKSRVKYLKSVRFALDVLALPPLSVLPLRHLGFSHVYLELHKLVRVWRIPKYIALLDDLYARHFELLKMCKVLLVILLLSHFVACGRFWFGYDEHGTNHWLPHRPSHNHEQSTRTKYLMSLFWAFGMLTGLFEGELPHAHIEFWFAMLVGLCGFSLFTYLCATFFMISKCESSHSEAAEARINQLKHLLSFHHVPEPLKEQAVEYLKRYYTHSEANDREAMRLLCPSIAKDVRVALVKDMVAKIPYFAHCNEQFIIAITSLLEMVSLPANFVLFNEGDIGDSMYLVNSGVLHVVVDGIKVREVRKGHAFGEMSIFLDRPRFATIITTTYCTLYKLARFHLNRMLEGYPQYAASIPNKVEEMAQKLFGRHITRASATDLARRGSLAAQGKKKTITSLIRKHVLKDKAKVAPSPFLALVSSAVASSQANAANAASAANAGSSGTIQVSLGSTTGSGNSTKSMRKLVRKSLTARASLSQPQPSPTQPNNDSGTSAAPNPAKDDQGPTTSGLVAPAANAMAPTNGQGEGSIHQRNSSLLMMGQALFDHLIRKPSANAPFWSRLLLPRAIDFESRRRMWWLLSLQLAWMYNWAVVPLFLSFRLLDQRLWVVELVNTLMDMVLWADVYANFNLSFVENAEKIVDTVKTARRYARSQMALDVALALPYSLVLRHWLLRPELARIPRLLRVWRIPSHFHEVDAFLQLSNKQRLALLTVMLFVLYHVVACLYFSVTYLEGFSSAEDSWLPSHDLELHRVNASAYVDVYNETYAAADSVIDAIVAKQYFRSLYYACNVLTALGRTIEPASDTQYCAALVFMLSGFFITAVAVDIVQKRFTASALEQKEFFSTRSRIQMFLRRQSAPLALHKRVSAFLDYWWSAHRGAFIGGLLEELPETIKHDIMCSICKPALQTLTLLNGVRPVFSDLEQVFVDNIKFILYGQGETIYRHGDYAGGLFFLLQGEVGLILPGSPPRSIPPGGFFGTAALQLQDDSASYTERTTAVSGCVLVFAAREHLRAMQRKFPTLVTALGDLEKRFQDPKLAKASTMAKFGTMSSSRGGGQSRCYRYFAALRDVVFDPDATLMIAWETWVFVAMTAQWVSILLRVCFEVASESFVWAETLLVLLELSFLADMFMRSHLGYYEFGNKIMDTKLLRRKYFRSPEFAIDLVALLPLFVISWGLAPPTAAARKRLELLNLNKLARLLKVPTQFTALENKYIKYTLELRVFKLVYYTFLLSHLFGCVWFDFTSRHSYHHAVETGEELHKWLPSPSLLEGDTALQYFASLFWSFGLMSASNPGELPKDVAECLCGITTMTCGFFLFAYVIGNFSDIIDLMDAENREFYAKLTSLRHLLAHFQLPVSTQERFKAYFFFKRFHSITQEHLLEQSLPPSLLTDIRMVHLQPMIMKVSFLADMEGSVTRMLVSQFGQVMVVKDEFVYKFGESGSNMFFVFAGVLDSLVPRDEFMRDTSAVEPSLSRTAPDDAISHATSDDRLQSSDNLVAAQPDQRHHVRPPIRPSPKIHPRPQNLKSGIDLNTLTQLNRIEAGSYFGENALFDNSARKSYVVARSSCILYRLSRNSLELVFNRYPEWKQKVLRIMKVQQEQHRLNRIAHEEMLSIATGMEAHGEDELSAERTEGEMLGKRGMRSNTSVGRKASVSPRFLHAQQSQELWTYSPRRLLRLPGHLVALFRGVPAQSWLHLTWLKLVAATTLFMAILVPYRISFDALNRAQGGAVVLRELETVFEFVFVADMWVNWRLQRSAESMDLYEQDHRQAYRKERLRWDVLAALPIDYLVSSFSPHPVFRLNRCVKMRNLVHYLHELHRRSLHNEMHRLRTTFVLYLVFMYWGAAMYFAVAVYDHFGDEWNAWLPDKTLADPELRSLRLVRGLFFAMTAFIKKGRTFTPDSTPHFIFTIITCFIGLLIMAFMIGEFANLFISYIGDEVAYRKNYIAVELYVARRKLATPLQARIQAFMSSLWSSHRGIDYQALLEEVPPSIRTESVLNIADLPLQAFVDDVFRPINRPDPPGSANELTQAVARHLKFEGFPRGEDVLVEGSIAKSMYFVVRGALHAASRSHPSLFQDMTFTKGDYFGEKGLLGYSVGVFSVRTLRACDLLSLRAEGLLQVLRAHCVYSLAIEFAERAVHAVKAEKSGDKESMTMMSLEQRWGGAVLAAIHAKREACRSDAPGVDAAAQRANKKTRAMLDSHFALHGDEEVYGAFRSLLQLLVPNGRLHTFADRSHTDVLSEHPGRNNTNHLLPASPPSSASTPMTEIQPTPPPPATIEPPSEKTAAPVEAHPAIGPDAKELAPSELARLSSLTASDRQHKGDSGSVGTATALGLQVTAPSDAPDTPLSPPP